MTLIVNLFAGPGTGKSTNAALAFGQLKLEGINCEMAHEFAKDLTWEERHTALGFQPYIIGKQMYKVHRLIGKVDVIITDSPILFGLAYKKPEMPDSFDQFILDIFRQWNTLNIFLRRDLAFHPFNPKGRNQDINEAQDLDNRMLNILTVNKIPYYSVLADQYAADEIVDFVKEEMAYGS